MKINWKYTIGEILIVIIGISIAFALNNWKENSTNKQLKIKYLNNLVLDVEQEISLLEDSQKDANHKIKLIKQVKRFLGTQQSGRDSIVKKVFEIARMNTFHPVNITYQALINSGDMKLMDNLELHRKIEAHYSLHEDVLKNYKRIEKIHENYLGDFFINSMDYEKIAQGNSSFLDNPLLKNIIISIEGSYFMVLQGNNQCLKSNQELLQKIKEELGNN